VGIAGAPAEGAVSIRNLLKPLPVEADVMSEPTALPPDPLPGSALVAYWSYGYDMPDDLGGGFVTGELLLRADGVLLRRQTRFFPAEDGSLSEGFGPWKEVTWWTGEAEPGKAARVLYNRGYDLHELDPANMSNPPGSSVPSRSSSDEDR